jgi:pantoate--beta-alanine ligase
MTNERPLVVHSVAAMRKEVDGWRRAGDVVGVVPTMGALHDGHLALVQAAKSECDRVIATIFVNPAQFAANEDLDAYPRGEVEDLAKLRELETDLAFMPDVGEMYPDGFVTKVGVKGITEILCGLGRPVHFGGVATVVSKLFNQSQADRAYFGEKDYQQFLVVRRMARDLDIPIEVVPVPTVREADGLAMSSRNVYLSDEQRAKAPALYRVIRDVAAQISYGKNATVAVAWGRKELETCGFDRIEYFEALEAEMLGPIDFPSKPGRVFVAAHLGSIRLIDNIAV